MSAETFGLAPLTEASFLAELAAVVGLDAAEALLDAAGRELTLTRPVENLDRMVELADVVMGLGAQLRVTARSARIRAITYRAIGRSAPIQPAALTITAPQENT